MNGQPLGLGYWLSFGASFLFVLVLMFSLYYVLRRMALHSGRSRTQKAIQVIESHVLGNRQQLLLVKVRGQEILLGITAQQISMLSTTVSSESTPAQPQTPEVATAPPPSPQEFLSGIFRRRRSVKGE